MHCKIGNRREINEMSPAMTFCLKAHHKASGGPHPEMGGFLELKIKRLENLSGLKHTRQSSEEQSYSEKELQKFT